jgi:hypothetical protein
MGNLYTRIDNRFILLINDRAPYRSGDLRLDCREEGYRH